MALAIGLGVWVRAIILNPVVGGSKLNKNGWGKKVGGCVKQFGKKKWWIKSRRLGMSISWAI